MEPVRAVRNAGRLGRKTKLKHRLKIGIGLQRCESVQNYAGAWAAAPAWPDARAAEFSPPLLPLLRAHFELTLLSPLEAPKPSSVGRRPRHIFGLVGPFGLVQYQPTLGDRIIQAGLVLRRRALQLEQVWPVDLLDIDAALLDRLERIGELQQLAGGDFGISEWAGLDEFHVSALPASCSSRNTTLSAPGSLLDIESRHK